MKKILSLSLLIFFAFSAPASVFAANPSVTLSTSPDKHFINLGFTNLQSVTRVSYTLMYQNGATETGFTGGFKVMPKTPKALRRQILGTCSTKRCTYNKNPKNFHIEATFYLKNGATVQASKNL